MFVVIIAFVVCVVLVVFVMFVVFGFVVFVAFGVVRCSMCLARCLLLSGVVVRCALFVVCCL